MKYSLWTLLLALLSLNLCGGPNLDELFFNATDLSKGDCSAILSTYDPNSTSAAQAIVSPNPAKAAFNLWVPEFVKSISVTDVHGIEVYRHDSIQDEGSIQFGDQLTAGVYHVKIFYKTGRVEVKKIQKAQ